MRSDSSESTNSSIARDLSTEDLIAGISDERTRRAAEKYAYLLGMTSQLPGPSPNNVRQPRMVQAINDTGIPHPSQSSAASGVDRRKKSKLAINASISHLTTISRVSHPTKYNKSRR